MGKRRRMIERNGTIALAVLAFAAALLSGCSKSSSSDQSAGSSSSGAPTNGASAMGAAAPGAALGGDAVHGKAIFTQNCATCHGATGTEGGVGPSLKNEKSRKNAAAAIAWIKNPTPPMPKLYPSPLGEKDVQDVAAYVESL